MEGGRGGGGGTRERGSSWERGGGGVGEEEGDKGEGEQLGEGGGGGGYSKYLTSTTEWERGGTSPKLLFSLTIYLLTLHYPLILPFTPSLSGTRGPAPLPTVQGSEESAGEGTH